MYKKFALFIIQVTCLLQLYPIVAGNCLGDLQETSKRTTAAVPQQQPSPCSRCRKLANVVAKTEQYMESQGWGAEDGQAYDEGVRVLVRKEYSGVIPPCRRYPPCE